MKLPYEEFDLSGIKTYPLRSRQSKVGLAQFATPYKTGSRRQRVHDVAAVVAGGEGFQGRSSTRSSRRKRDGQGDHLGPRRARLEDWSVAVLVDLMERGFVSAIATNGAGIIHDFEIALSGGTSEDVDATLGPGTFGMAEETGAQLNRAIKDGVTQGLGHWPVGRHVSRRDRVRRSRKSASRRRVPAADSGDRACRRSAPTSFTCIRRRPARRSAKQPARFQVFRVVRLAARRRRLSQLRIGGGAAGSVPEGGRDRAQRRPIARRA